MTEPTTGPDDRPWASDDETEPTQPLRGVADPWVPPAGPPPAAAPHGSGETPGARHAAPAFPQAHAPEPGPYPGGGQHAPGPAPTTPLHVHAGPPAGSPAPWPVTGVLPAYQPAPPAGRVPGWLWPVVCLLALLLGLMGGAIGGAAYQRLNDDVGSLASPQTAPLPADNGSVAAVAEQVLPSTVQIIAGTPGEDGAATGSGFVVDRAGHVVTNNHVVAEVAADDGRIQIVDQTGNRYDAELVGRSPVYDLAVLYAAEAKQLEPAALGSAESLRVGEGVVAIGSPLGLTSTVTAGIVSAVDRPVTTGSSSDDTSYINAVQTDAAINPGNSGGPLVNLSGQVVGVNSAIATTGSVGGEAGNIGVGFAIPIDQVRTTTEQILSDGEARYPVIGATVKTGEVSPDDPEGAAIDEVLEGSPAERAGLRRDDVITAIDGQRVTDGIALIVAIRTHQPGDTVSLTLERDGQEQTIEVTLDSKVG